MNNPQSAADAFKAAMRAEGYKLVKRADGRTMLAIPGTGSDPLKTVLGEDAIELQLRDFLARRDVRLTVTEVMEQLRAIVK